MGNFTDVPSDSKRFVHNITLIDPLKNAKNLLGDTVRKSVRPEQKLFITLCSENRRGL